jgi:hypothetical protein
MDGEGRGFTTATLISVFVVGIDLYEYYKAPIDKGPDTTVVTTPRPGQDQVPGNEPVKHQRGARLPKKLLPTLHVGPWTLNGETGQEPNGQSVQIEPGAQVPSGFIGRWTGRVSQTGEGMGDYEVGVMVDVLLRWSYPFVDLFPQSARDLLGRPAKSQLSNDIGLQRWAGLEHVFLMRVVLSCF